MGDPKKIRSKYSGPRHPWEGARINNERQLIRNYGLKNKKDIWKVDSKLTKFKDQVKKLTATQGSQAEKEKAQLAQKLINLGLMKEGQSLNDVLGLEVGSLMDRRLQSVIVKMGYAHTMKQARQFIIHRHVTVNDAKMTVPSYLVKEGDVVGFSERSALSNEAHPERLEKKPSNEKIEKPAKEEETTEAIQPAESTDEKKEEVKEEPKEENVVEDKTEEVKEESVAEEVAEEKVEETAPETPVEDTKEEVEESQEEPKKEK